MCFKVPLRHLGIPCTTLFPFCEGSCDSCTDVFYSCRVSWLVQSLLRSVSITKCTNPLSGCVTGPRWSRVRVAGLPAEVGGLPPRKLCRRGFCSAFVVELLPPSLEQPRRTGERVGADAPYSAHSPHFLPVTAAACIPLPASIIAQSIAALPVFGC